jgi:uncharacterized protein (TIGR02246 family)
MTPSIVGRTLGLLLLAALTTAALADQQADEQAIRDLEARWNEAIAARDAAWIAGIYAPDGRFMPPGGKAVAGREAVEAGWAAMLAPEGYSLVITPTEIRASASGDVAYDLGTWESKGPEGRGKYVVVWKKIDRAWKVIADILNSDG